MSYKDVAAAMNMNTLEQRINTKQKILRSLELGIPKETIIKMLEEEIHFDRHRLVKFYNFE